MKQIFVVERHDKQPFNIPINGGTITPATMIRVCGVGFLSHDEADAFLHIVGDHQTFNVMIVVENRPMEPGFSPASNQIN